MVFSFRKLIKEYFKIKLNMILMNNMNNQPKQLLNLHAYPDDSSSYFSCMDVYEREESTKQIVSYKHAYILT